MNNKDFPRDYRIVPSDSNVVEDIFANKFDITWHHSHRRDNPNQRVWSRIEYEHSEDDGTVSYVFNNEYFRCDEFTKVHNGRHILFAGCSETEGQGGNVEDVWANILLEEVKKTETVSGYFNIGKSGYGWQKVITQLRIYIAKYGKPDNLFVLLPNIGRSIEWSAGGNMWHARQEHPRVYEDERPFEENMYMGEQTPERYKKTFIDFVISWRLFEDFCTASGINLLWGTWKDVDNYNIDKLNLFNNFVPLYQDDLLSNIDKYRKDAKLNKLDMNKRDGHHGRLFHEYWANMMLQEATKRGFLND